jgi:hypothetical protein
VVIVKSLTVICTLLAGRPVVAPPLLAVSVSVFTPIGQVTEGLAPVAVPHLPDQCKVTEHLSGSEPLPLRVTVAPFALAAFTV